MFGLRRRHRHGADGAGGLIVEDGVPGAAVIVGLPHAAVIDADVKRSGLLGDPGHAHRAAAAERPDHAPLQAGIERWVKGLGGSQREKQGRRE